MIFIWFIFSILFLGTLLVIGLYDLYKFRHFEGNAKILLLGFIVGVTIVASGIIVGMYW